jgi:hypothetical protein
MDGRITYRDVERLPDWPRAKESPGRIPAG